MKFSAAILFILISISSPAQEIHFNMMGGLSYSWLRANKNVIESKGSLFSYKAHIQCEYWFNDKYAFTAGIGFSIAQGGALEFKKGGDLLKGSDLSLPDYHNLPAGTRIDYKMNYLDFPFGLKLRTGSFKGYRFYVQAPEFSLSFRTKARAKIAADNLPYTVDEDIRGSIAGASMFYGINLGFEKTISDDLSLLAGIRFYQSFTDITNDTGIYTDGSKENSKGILSSVDFRIGITF
ncbi:MAG: PorT family protein [Saprospiraceae bacterium]|nr:PorT family protein [Saprospiraceae bacterium]